MFLFRRRLLFVEYLQEIDEGYAVEGKLSY